MDAIGGYFGFENNAKKGTHFHDSPYLLDCGRTALEVILSTTKPKKIYVPYYTCNALLEPLEKSNIPFSFYAINEALEIADKLTVKQNEYIIYINFFGIKDSYCKQLIKDYSNQLILDNTMAFFFKHKVPYWGFNSCRKFFAVPDGAYLQSPVAVAEKLLPKIINDKLNTNFLFLRNENLVEQGYQYFLKNEECFGKGIYKMSNYSTEVLTHLNYKSLIQKRNDNFSFLHHYLSGSNTINSNLFSSADCAMFYPYLPKKKIVHKLFWDEKIFIPKLWTDCDGRTDGYSWEKKLSASLLPLPIDHRYNEDDLKNILKLIL